LVAQLTSQRAVDIRLRTRQCIPEDSELYTRRRENFKSHIVNLYGEAILCFIRSFIALMMEAARTSETSVDNYFTRQYNPEDNSELHTRRRENFKSQTLLMVVKSRTDFRLGLISITCVFITIYCILKLYLNVRVMFVALFL
jgi:hypothetical protein